MSIEDAFTIPRPKNGQARGVVTTAAAAASLDRGRREASKVYGFELAADDPRCVVVGTRREGGKAIVTYGSRGRRLDAAQLAYELNN